MARYSVGLDFGTESVRTIIVDIKTGRIAALAAVDYDHGVIDRTLPTGQKLPGDYALQHPADWLEAMGKSARAALKKGKIKADDVVGIGVDFTSCTMLGARADGTPLCLEKKFAKTPLAWPKLWKHHGAKEETDRINEVARQRGEPWLARYGGTIGLEWFFPKVFETLRAEPGVYAAADLFVEAGDWLVWQLTSGPFPRCKPGELIRSTCQAGYKAMWNKQTGYPSREYFEAVDPKLANVVAEKMPGTLMAPGERAGALTPASAKLLGLNAGTPVSAAIIDAHSGVPGSGVSGPDALVLVMGTSSCHMMCSRGEQLAAGVAGVVEDGILPGYFGYETGQASVGDAFAWVAEVLDRSHDKLGKKAGKLPPGSGGVIAIDWLNGCRSPLMDGRLSGGFVGITLSTTPEQLYRAMLEATAYGLKWIVDTLAEAGVPVNRLIASGGLPNKSPLLMQICADVLGQRIELAASDQSVALGAAILGCIAAGKSATGYIQIAQAIEAMAHVRKDLAYYPDELANQSYARFYGLYRKLTQPAGVVAGVMRELRTSVS